jgi:tetratricopeptide (TPR) repeat protein
MPIGRIKFLDPAKKYGFIVAEDQSEFYFQTGDLRLTDPPVVPGDTVDFQVLPSKAAAGKRPRAFQIALRSRAHKPAIGSSASIPNDNKKSRIEAKEKSSELLRHALDARNKKEYDRARTLFERSLERLPSQTAFQAYGAMERELAASGNYERASRVYERAIKEYPKSGKLYEDYGMLYQRTSPARAIELFQLGLAEDPNHRILHKYLGHALFATNDLAVSGQAERHFKLAEQAGLLDALGALERSLLHIRAGHPRGRLTLEFMEKASFAPGLVRNHNLTNGFDLVARTTQSGYVESYELSEGLWFRCVFKNRPLPADVNEFLYEVEKAHREPSVLHHDVIFFVAQNITGIRDHLYRLLEQPSKHPTIVPIDEELMRAVIASPRPQERFKQHLDEWLYKRNLYEENFPVSGRQFFGREQELAGLMRSIENRTPVGLFGLRKVGKTSLLTRLTEKRTDDLVVYVDLQSVPEGVKDANYIYWLIANQLSNDLNLKYPHLAKLVSFRLAGKHSSFYDLKKPESAPALFDADIRALTTIVRENMTRPFKILILFDEVERLLPVGTSDGFRGYDGLFSYLRGISQANPLVNSIVTGANPTICDTPQWEGRDNPVFKFYREMFLPPFGAHECTEMVERLGKGMGVTYTPNSLARIYKETGGHPFITRQLCSRISRYFEERPLNVDVPKVDKGVQEFLFHDSGVFKEIMDRLHRDFPLEKELLIFIASGVNTTAALTGLVSDTRESLRHLVGYELIARDGDTFRIKLDLLSRWLREYWLNENK